MCAFCWAKNGRLQSSLGNMKVNPFKFEILYLKSSYLAKNIFTRCKMKPLKTPTLMSLIKNSWKNPPCTLLLETCMLTNFYILEPGKFHNFDIFAFRKIRQIYQCTVINWLFWCVTCKLKLRLWGKFASLYIFFKKYEACTLTKWWNWILSNHNLYFLIVHCVSRNSWEGLSSAMI